MTEKPEFVTDSELDRGREEARTALEYYRYLLAVRADTTADEHAFAAHVQVEAAQRILWFA